MSNLGKRMLACWMVVGFAAVSCVAAEDLSKPVRPGGVDGRPFWNRYSVHFLYAPAFDFQPVAGAERYRFTVTDDRLVEHVFDATRPTDALSPVWNALPAGFAKVTVDGVDAGGRVCGRSGERRFWKSRPFAAAESRIPWGYGAAATRYFEWLFEQPNTVSFREKGVPNGGDLDLLEIYPSKMNASLIRAMLHYAERCPERREAALRTARAVADYMLSISQPADAPLAHFTPTYWKKENQTSDFASVRYRGQNMLVYPALMAGAFLDLYGVTSDEKYFRAAAGIAETYAKLQLANGTWYLKVWEKDASPVLEEGDAKPYYLVPSDVALFLLRFGRQTGDVRWTAIVDRAIGYLDCGPLRTYDWAAQFEDTEQTRGYIGQCSAPPMGVASLLLERFPHDERRLAQVRELVAWVEDQFVLWRRPCRPDGFGILSEKHEGFSPQWNGGHPKFVFENWFDVPTVAEKYRYFHPETGLSAKLIRLYLKLNRATGDALFLEKARAFGDGLVKFQAFAGGRKIPTHYWKDDFRGNDGHSDWTNCGVAAALGLEALSEAVEPPLDFRVGCVLKSSTLPRKE